jgi:hypothetical protein
LFVEGLAAAVTFDDERHDELCGFEGCEPLTAGEALATTPNLSALCREARVVNLGRFVTAEGTVHGVVPSGASAVD